MTSTLKPRQNRPRDSILDLFDPFHNAPATPTRDNASTGDSDKENTTPIQPTRLLDEELTMSTFFSRKKVDKLNENRPIVLKKRLVDVGDATFADASLIAADSSSDEEDTDSTNATVTVKELLNNSISSERDLSTPRRPLGDLLLDTPMIRPPTSIKQGSGKRPRLSTNKTITLINSPFSCLSNARPSTPQDDGPHIVVTEADSSILSASLSNLRLTESTTAPLTDVSIFGASSMDSRDSISGGFLDPGALSCHANRMSLDLQTSFNMQMQCPEASFDLLNDKISFTDMLSSGPGADDSFDMDVDVENIREAWGGCSPKVNFVGDTKAAPSPPGTPTTPSQMNTPQQSPPALSEAGSDSTASPPCATPPTSCPPPAPTPPAKSSPATPTPLGPPVVRAPPSCTMPSLASLQKTSALRIIKRPTKISHASSGVANRERPTPSTSAGAIPRPPSRMAPPRADSGRMTPAPAASTTSTSTTGRSSRLFSRSKAAAGPAPSTLQGNSKNTVPRTASAAASSRAGTSSGSGLKAPTKAPSTSRFGSSSASSTAAGGAAGKAAASEIVRAFSRAGFLTRKAT